MKIKTSLMLFAAAALLSLASAAVIVGDINASHGVLAERRLLTVPAKDVNGYRIFRNDAPVAEFSKNQAGTWTVKVPGPAGEISDYADVKALRDLAALAELALRNPAEVSAETAGLVPGKCVQLTLCADGGETQDLLVGAPAAKAGMRYAARLEEPDRVHEIRDDVTAVLFRDPAEFRSLDLFRVPAEGPNGISLAPGGKNGAESELRLQKEADGWYLVRPVLWPADDEQVNQLLRSCGGMRAEKLVAESVADPAQYGFVPNGPTVTLKVAGGEQTVLIGALDQASSLPYAMRRGGAQLYLVGRWIYDELGRLATAEGADRHDRYRKRTLDLIGDALVKTIILSGAEGTLTFTRTGEEWSAGGCRDFDTDKEQVDGLVMTLKSIIIASFASEKSADRAKFGLDKPYRRIYCKDAGGRCVADLLIGQPTSDGHFYVAFGDRPQIVELYAPLLQFLAQPVVGFRSKQLAKFDHHEALEVALTREGAATVYRAAGPYNWQTLKPETRLLGDDNNAFIMMLAKHLSLLRCLGYEAENTPDLGKFGLDRPYLHVVVTLRSKTGGGGKTALDLLVGNEMQWEGADKVKAKSLPRYACLGGTRTVFLLAPEVVRALDRDYK